MACTAPNPTVMATTCGKWQLCTGRHDKTPLGCGRLEVD